MSLTEVVPDQEISGFARDGLDLVARLLQLRVQLQRLRAQRQRLGPLRRPLGRNMVEACLHRRS